MKNIFRLGIIMLALVLLAGRAGAETLNIPLYKLAPARTVDLKCTKSDYDISLPIPERWQVSRMILTVGYINSTNLIKDISQLVVKMNDTPVAQAKLNPLSPEGRLEVSIPPGLLEPGYNTLGFTAVQHHTTGCEHPCAPDLWTTLRLDEASVRIEYTLKPVPLKLSAVSSFIFDPKIFPYSNVNVITEGRGAKMINVAGIAASGIARKFDYRKVLFSASAELRQGEDNVLIGRKAFVEGFLRQRGYDITGIEGPFIKVMHLPRPGAARLKRDIDPYHSLIVVSGLEEDHLKLAAETLAFMNFPYPGTDSMIVEQFKLSNVPLYGGLMMLSSDKIYRLKTLGFSSHSFEGLQPAGMEISFRLPADFFIKENQQAELKLNFSYGGGLRSDSVLNVFLNGVRVRAINLAREEGDSIEGYKIAIPTYLFKPGTNTIRFTPILTPHSKECDLIQPESLFLTIFENSTFYIPPMPHFVEMPQIELFMMNGFPFTSWPDGYESTVYIPRADDETVEAALNAIGLITQRNAYPFFSVSINVGDAEALRKDRRDIIAIGDVGSMPEEIRRGAPIKMLNKSEVQYPVANGFTDNRASALSKQISGLGAGAGAIMEFQSPFREGRTVLLLTAADTKGLARLAREILEPNVQAQSKGDAVVVEFREPDSKVSSMNAGKRYFTGTLGKASYIGRFFYMHPALYYAIIIALVLIASTGAYYILHRFRGERAHEPGRAEEPRGAGHPLKSTLDLIIGIFIKRKK